MAKRGLTRNEQQVLYGLVKHPTLNDRELSETIGIKVSTVTAIRRRLRRADFYVTRCIPLVHRLGWEILAGVHGRISTAAGAKGAARLREILQDRYPTIFHVAYTGDHVVLLSFAPDYTAFRADLDDLRLAMHRADLLDGSSFDACVLPVRRAAIANFFDYSHVLGLAFGIDDRVSANLQPVKVGDLELSRKETDVLAGLVRFPELSDKAVAQRIKASRQAVSKMRREFEASGLLRTVCIPNVRALGFELYAHALSRFTPVATIRARAEVIERTLRVTPAFFYSTSDAESIFLGTVRSYEHFSALRSSVTRQYEERGFLSGEPSYRLGLVSMTDLPRNCEFGPLVEVLRTGAAGPRR